MSDALLLVDLQNDFMPGGALAVADGDAVVPVCNHLQARFDRVVATQDWHPADHASFASQHPGRRPFEVIDLNGLQQVLWPDHCVQGTPGAELVDALDTARIERVFRKGDNPDIDSYSGFFDNGHRRATGLAGYLRDRGVDTIYLAGVAEDVCVFHTALDARRLGFEVRLVREATRPVEASPGDAGTARRRMVEAGVKLVSADDVAAGRA